jgi:flagellar motor switch protein FliN/FliY
MVTSLRVLTTLKPYRADTIAKRDTSTKHAEARLASLDNVWVDIAVVLGTSSMPIHQVLRLGRGAIIELDTSEEDEVRILANNLSVAKGTVIVSGNRIAVEVKELLPRAPDAK